MDTAGSAPWYRLVGSLVHESGEPPGCWSQASLPIRSETEAVPMTLPVPPKTELAEAQRSEASSLLRNYNTPQDLVRPTEVCATQIADSKTAESTDLFSISSDLAGSRPRCASFICADSSTGEVEQGELERADQAGRAAASRTANPSPRSPCLPHGMPLCALPSHSLLSHLAPFPA